MLANSREPEQTLQSVASDLGLCYLSMSHEKNASLIGVKLFCCICYSHHLYFFFIELDNNWIKSGFNHMNRLELPPEFFCQTSFWQNDLVLLVDIES